MSIITLVLFMTGCDMGPPAPPDLEAVVDADSCVAQGQQATIYHGITCTGYVYTGAGQADQLQQTTAAGHCSFTGCGGAAANTQAACEETCKGFDTLTCSGAVIENNACTCVGCLQGTQ